MDHHQFSAYPLRKKHFIYLGVIILTVSLKKVLEFIVSHIAVYVLSYLTLYSTIIFLPLVLPPQRLLYIPVLYAIVILIPLIAIQLGVAIHELIRLKPAPVLLIYYFLFDPDKDLPHEALDPTKSGIGLASLILLLSGGYIAWPVFTLYGLLTMYEIYGAQFSPTPEFIRMYVEQIAFAIPPFLAILLLILILTVLTIERRYISR